MSETPPSDVLGQFLGRDLMRLLLVVTKDRSCNCEAAKSLREIADKIIAKQ